MIPAGVGRRRAIAAITAAWLAAGGLPAAEPAAKKTAVPAPAAKAGEPAPSESVKAGGDEAARVAAGGRPVPRTYLDFAVAGGPVMIPIALTSLIFLTYLVERLIKIRRSRILPAPLVAALKGAAGPLPREQVEAICVAHPSAAAAILRAALGRLDEPYEDLERGVNNAAQREVAALRRNIRAFAIIATVAPLLGLLGTVTGLIGAFREVSVQGLGQGQAYAAGIYEALANTAAGLIVAIPALVAYHWFMARVDGFLQQIDFLVVDFVEAHRRAVRT